MVPDDVLVLFMLLIMCGDAVIQDFGLSLQVIENLHIDVGIELHGDVIHHRFSNTVDLVEDNLYALVRELSAFKDCSRLVTDLELGHSVHQLLQCALCLLQDSLIFPIFVFDKEHPVLVVIKLLPQHVYTTDKLPQEAFVFGDHG